MVSRKVSTNLKDVYSIDDVKKLYEETSNELKSGTWARVARRVRTQYITSYYLGVTKEGKIRFKTTSGTTRGKFWYQEIYFKDINVGRDLLRENPQTAMKTIIGLLYSGDLLVYCNDYSFRYFWAYKAWKAGYGLRAENRFPKARNPKLSGTICKHLYSVLTVLPFHINQIARDFKEKGVI